MEEFNLYKDIQARTNGEIFIGVVGPVRTGKSTFIRRFMELMVLPGLKENDKAIATDEMPTSGKGRTITTVEPKFIPKQAAELALSDDVSVKMRLIDCVGYMVKGAAGMEDDSKVRMVKTPWSEKEIPFTEAAEIGTRKVIRDHATIGLVVTCDGTFGEIPRENYQEPEKRAITELKNIGKPFLVVVNSEKPYGEEAKQTVSYINQTYGVPALAINCEQLRKEDVMKIMEQILYEFPLIKVEFYVPKWVEMLPGDHTIKENLVKSIREMMKTMVHIRDISSEALQMDYDFIKSVKLDAIELAQGAARVRIDLDDTYYYEMLSDMAGVPIQGEYQLLSIIRELTQKKSEYEKVENALSAVHNVGYGVITPNQEDIMLESPVVIKQGSKYGVKIKAASQSVHLIKVDIETEIAPIVGSEQQAQDLISFINENSSKEGIWNTIIFGKSIEQLVNDGIRTKLSRIGEESQNKLQDTMKKIVNESNGGLICIII